MYSFLNQNVAAELVKGWRQQAAQDQRAREARRARRNRHRGPSAAGAWALLRRGFVPRMRATPGTGELGRHPAPCEQDEPAGARAA